MKRFLALAALLILAIGLAMLWSDWLFHQRHLLLPAR
jgi:hypothetical protein